MTKTDPACTPGNQGRAGAPLIRFQGVCKAYAGSVVLNDVTFDISQGSIHALVGENGAGKSTLIKLITGVTGLSGGVIEFDGDAYEEITPSRAREIGICVVHQERHVCPDLSVMDNVLLGRIPKMFGSRGPVRWSTAVSETLERLEQIGLNVSPHARVGDLTASQIQLVEIARALSANARLVVMDEPTAALSRLEVRLLSQILRRLKREGVTILYVTHHLEEVFELADTVTILRNGEHVVTRPVDGLEMSTLIRLMIGRDPRVSNAPTAARHEHKRYLAARNVSYRTLVRDVSFDVAAGEIVAITGGAGSGSPDLAKCIVGAVRLHGGSVEVEGRGLIKRPQDAARMDIAFVPGDRKRTGIQSERDVVDNVDLSWLARRAGHIDLPSRRTRVAAGCVDALRVECPSIHSPIRYLSGGNQQKVLLGRWLGTGMNLKCLVLEDPTEGVDIGSRFEIYELLRRLAVEGVAVLIFTADLEEVELIADRALVMREGRIVGSASAPAITAHNLLEMQYGAAGESDDTTI